jgi:hypothetical protein
MFTYTVRDVIESLLYCLLFKVYVVYRFIKVIVIRNRIYSSCFGVLDKKKRIGIRLYC